MATATKEDLDKLNARLPVMRYLAEGASLYTEYFSATCGSAWEDICMKRFKEWGTPELRQVIALSFDRMAMAALHVGLEEEVLKQRKN